MKNIIKKIQISLGIITLPILFIGCGGDGDDASFKNSETLIPITIQCVGNPTTTNINSYITLNSGDVIVKDSSNAEVSIYHDSNGIKKVCLVTASAHIIRK